MDEKYIITMEQAREAGISKPEAKKLIAANKARLNNEIVAKLAENGSQTALRLLFAILNLEDPELIYTGKTKAEVSETQTGTIRIEVSEASKVKEEIDKI